MKPCKRCKKEYDMQIACLCKQGAKMIGLCKDCILADEELGKDLRRILDNWTKNKRKILKEFELKG